MNYKNLKNHGSVLLYVLWILVVISLLAFKLSSASRVVMLKQVSEVTQIKKKMQLRSAIQFAIFKILNDQWENIKFEQNLNDQRLSIEIYNESGFISLYDLSSQSLKNVFEKFNIDSSGLEELRVQFEEKDLRFNDFAELSQYEGISQEDVLNLIPYISIYHNEGVNPAQSPAEVLLKLEGVDQYRVNKLIESTDFNEKIELRNEVIEIMKSHNLPLTDSMNNYYRVLISLDSQLYHVFLKFNRRENEFDVVNSIALNNITN